MLIGRNSSGKSTVLRALQHFYDVGAKITEHDFHGGWAEGGEVEISVTFSNLTADETTVFGRHVKDGSLRVAKVYGEPGSSGAYYGYAEQVETFASLRNLSGKPFNDLYREIREKFKLPAGRSQAEREGELLKYEAEHPEECFPQRERVQFLGPPNVGGGTLDKYTGFIFVPAVQEAHDVAEGKEGPISALLTRIIVPRLEAKDAFRGFKKDAEERLRGLFEESNKSDLPNLAQRITSLLEQFAPGAAMQLWWDEVQAPKLKFPQVKRSLLDDGWPSPVGLVGHGLQRSLIMALLQLEAESRNEAAEEPDQEDGEEGQDVPTLSRSVILAVEEPELYLHPSRCRHLASVLAQLAESTENDFQIVCATHSPLFLDLARFPGIRLVRKQNSSEPDRPRESKVAECDADHVAGLLATAAEAKNPEAFTGETLLANLRRVLHPNPSVTEGFFANVVVLVEGETDVGVLVELARIKEAQWDRLGVVVVRCGGKSSIDRPAIVFREVGIPIFLLFDSDKAEGLAKPKNSAELARPNRSLQRVCGVEEPVDWPHGLSATHPFAAFENHIEDYIEESIGEAFEKAKAEVSEELGFRLKGMFKTREGAARVMRKLSTDDMEKLVILNEVVDAVTTLAESAAGPNAAGPIAAGPIAASATDGDRDSDETGDVTLGEILEGEGLS